MSQKDSEKDTPEAGTSADHGSASSALKEKEKAKAPAKKDDNKAEEEELSEEDQQLKSELEMLVERLKEPDTALYKPALDALKDFIRTSTSSMTAVPKPLKFLRPHYQELSDLYEKWPQGDLQSALADVLSVLGMTYADSGRRDSLRYRLLAPSSSDEIGNWGHEYVRHLALEIGDEHAVRLEKEESFDDLMDLALQLVPFFLKHNAEADAVDLLLELEAIEKLPPFVDKDTYARVCLYIVSCVNLLPPPDDQAFLRTAFNIYLSQKELTQAISVAIRLDDHDSIRAVFDATDDVLVHKQLAFILARQQIWLELPNEEVQECLSNTRLSEYFLFLAKELNVLEPKVPEDIYKSHLEHTRGGPDSGLVDSAKQNLAASFVNAFVNAGFGKDKLMVVDEEASSWVYKNKDSGMLSATAGVATILLWDVEQGLQQLDKYMYSSEEYIKAGSLLGIGIVNTSVHNESDPALALLSEHVESRSVPLRLSAIIGLGLAYAGSQRQDIAGLLLPLIADTSLSMQLSALATLSLGLTFVGSCNGDITETILQTLMERDEPQLSDKWARFMSLGLGLLYMGKQDAADVIIETLKAIEHPIGRNTQVLVDICSFAGTGNVLKIQQLLHICSEKPPTDDKEEGGSSEEKGDDLYQGYAVLGLAIIAMGEDIGSEMVLRQFGHLMHYGEGSIRRAVPLAMGLVSASNPEMKVFDTLSRYSHDGDLDVAVNAIFAMGLVGAGTNNARLAQLLRQLASYYSKEANSLFMVRIAQGLLHLAKGTMTLTPFHTERQILSNVSLAGLLTVLVSLVDANSFILDSAHYLLYFLTPAMHARHLITLDTDLQPIQVNVRVGQAVDTVGQAGRPKTITGWVTHSTPVLLGHGERAELENDEYIALASTLEGLVILKKNENRAEEA
ncbi:armadillo-type protein [Myxozyma melibiosi]|uniref:26S proteasome regulatory subunit RPN1 n=1 Tax=Myxozyma melibiosi TaxID=54550 RepID=A0ABR1F5W4_9ASCO